MVKVVSSSFLKDNVIKSVLNEYDVKSQEMTKDEINFGTEIIDPLFDPFLLDKLRDVSGLHDLCISVKAEDAILSGKKLISEDDNIPFELEELIDDFDFDEELLAFTEDLYTFGFAGLELLRDGDGQLKAINRISSLYIRMCRDKKRVIQKIGSDTNYFKLYNPEDNNVLNSETGVFNINITLDNRANELIWFNLKSNESQVYGKPNYLSELDAIITDNAIIEYQQGHFKANGIPNYIITVTGKVEDTDEEYTMDDWESDLEKEFKAISNEPGTALCVVIPSEDRNGVQVDVNKIGEEKKEGSFLELSESVADRIRRVHKVPKERIGDSDTEGLASNRTSTILKNYSKSTIANMQKRIANLVNKNIIREFDYNVKIQFLPANFEAENEMLERGILLLQNGAMTLGEFINRFGSEYELKMDDTDEYYNARFMNNQSLDQVLYGDTPLDAEAKLNTLIDNLDEDL